MSLASRPVDPFGLWDAQLMPSNGALPGGEALSYALPGEGAAEAVTPTWTLDLAGAPAALALHSRQVRAIQDGLAQAGARAEALLEQRYGRGAAGTASFALEPQARPAESPDAEVMGGDALHAEVLRAASRAEASFSDLLDRLEESQAGLPASGALSFGPDERAAGIPWDELRRKLEQLLDSVNRQLLHFAWVDTRLEGRLLARTTVDWAGDMRSELDPDIRRDQLAAHRRSLELAMASRAATLRTVLTVSQIAAKLAALITTPLGPVQLMALAWEFVQSVIMPALAAAQAETS